jgi:protein dithiol:quinone oxidoreductase
MMKMTPLRLWIFLALAAASIAFASVVVTPWLDLEPCHLCIFQRLLFMVLALLAGVAALTGCIGMARPVALLPGLLFLIIAATGGSISAYQSWLQWHPLESISCVGGQLGPIERLVEWLGQLVPSLFLATGFCEDKQLVIYGLSLANAAFAAFLLMLAAGIWAARRGWNQAKY